MINFHFNRLVTVLNCALVTQIERRLAEMDRGMRSQVSTFYMNGKTVWRWL